MNRDELKLIVQILADQSKAQKDIDRTVKLLQSYVSKNKGLYIDLQVDEKSASSALKAHEKTQEALAKSISNQRKRREKDDFNQSKAINKAIENDYIASQKTQEAIAKTMSVRRKKLMKSEFDQAKAINKQLLEQYDWKTVGINDKFKLGTDFQTFLNENPKVLKYNSERVKELQENISNINNKTDLRKVKSEFRSFKSEMESVGKTGRTFAMEMVNNAKKFATWFFLGGLIASTTRSLKEMVTNVISLDSSLVELSKVSDLSSTSLEKFTQRAFEAGAQLGRTGKEVIDAVTVFKRAGYTLNESFELGKASLLTTNIGDGIKNVEEASSALIAVLKGFQMDDSEVLKIVDAINETSNNAAIDFQNITEGLRRVSGTLGQTGSSLEQTIGMLTGGFGQLRDIEMVSSGLVMISQRLRGINEDGEAIEGLAPKLQKAFKEIAGIDIEDSNGELRSTYDILSDMARVFPTLSSKQQQYLGEMASGNRQVKVLNSILQGWQDVEQAVESATNSQGSSYEENQKYLDSIEGRLKQFESEFQKLSITVIDSDLIKLIVSGGGLIVKTLDSIISKFGLLGTVVATVAIVLRSNIALVILNTLIPALTGAAVSSAALAAAMQLIVPIAVITAFIALPKLIDHFTTSLKEQREEVETLSNSIESLNTEYQALSQKQNLTEAEEKRLELLKTEIEYNKILLAQEAQKLYKAEKINAPTVTEIMNNPYTGEMSNRDAIQQAIDDYAELNEVTDKTLAKQDETIAKRAELIKTFTEEAKRLQDLKDAGAKIDDADEDRLKHLYELVDAYNDEAEAIKAATEAQEGSADVMAKAVSDYATALKELEETQSKMAKGSSLSYEEMSKLKEVYPQLESAIYRTVDGWKIEESALKNLRETAKQTAIDQIKFEKEKTKVALQNAKDRIGILITEATTQAQFVKALLGNIQGSSQGVVLTKEQRKLQAQFNLFQQLKRSEAGFLSEVEFISSGSVLGGGGGSSTSKSTDPWKALHDAYDERLKLSKNYIEDRNFYNDWGADSEIEAWKRVKDYTEKYYREGKISHEKYAESIRDIDKSLFSARKKLAEQIRDTFSTIADTEKQIVDLYERKFKKLNDELDDWYDERKRKEQDSYNDQKKRYNDDLDAFRNYINDKKDLLNDQYDEDTFNQDLAEKQKELSDIQSKINELTLAVASGDRFAKVKKEELLVTLADKQKEIDKFVADRSRAIQLDALDDALSDYEDYIDDKQIALDKEHENELSKLDRLHREKVKRLEKEYSKEELYSKARKALMSGEYTELMSMFDEYQREQGTGWSALGNVLQTEFINRLKEAGLLLNELNEKGDIDVSVDGTNSGSGGKTVTAGKDGNAPKGTNIGDTVHTQGGTYKVVAPNTSGAKYNPASGLWSIKVHDAGGILDSGNIAINNSGKPEQILSPIQTEAFRTWMTKVPDLITALDIGNCSFPGLNQQLGKNITIDKLVNIEGNVKDDAMLSQIKKSTNDSLKELAKIINGGKTTISGFGV